MIPIAKILAPKQIVWENDRVQFEESYFSQSVEIRYSDMVVAYPVTFDRKRANGKNCLLPKSVMMCRDMWLSMTGGIRYMKFD